MNIKSLLTSFLILSLSLSYSQEDLITNTFGRNTISLNGYWKYIVDPYETGYYNYRYISYDSIPNPGSGAFFTNSKPKDKTDGVEYNFDQSDSLYVPGDWNSQKENLFYYEGTLWYKKSFDYKKSDQKNKVFVYFGAINYQADVYLNGSKLGRHIGGFTPFNYEITDFLNENDNYLVVKVDNKRKKEAVPTLNTDWFNYGGITRDVKLVEVPATFIADYTIRLNSDNDNIIEAYVQLSGEEVQAKKLKFDIPELDISKKSVTDNSGKASFIINTKNINYWKPEDPKLYKVTLSTKDEEISDKIGFRSIKTQGHEILLNGQQIFLKGICIHEENPLEGRRANSYEDAKLLLGWASELGCNYVRLAHYPHNENMVRMADSLGLMVWSEIPVYWTIAWDNKETYLNAETQLKEMISRDKNRASVIIWSMANETPVSKDRNVFLTSLAKKTRDIDNTRLISAALEQTNINNDWTIRTIDDPFADIVDILSFNQYIGWYDGLPDKCSKIEWKIDINKPLLISEFGAGAKYGLHADSLTRWSEEYQEYLYKETLEMITEIPQLAGFSPWILVDFRSPRRFLPGIQDGWNRKGLLSNKGEKKKAYFVLQEFYKSHK